MNDPNKKIRVVGEPRPEVDIHLLAQALVAFAMHQVAAETPDLKPSVADDEPQQEAS
ncbi:hypothetical protein ACWEF6_10545 [Amycolatopsis sp. NPDC004772]